MLRCGKSGHLSANCTNLPNAKRSRPDGANVIFDMTPWADDFRQWREAQAIGNLDPGLSSGSPPQIEVEDINGLEETKGCAIIDSGATVMCSSTNAAEEIQMQRINQSELGIPIVSTSD